MKKIYLLHFIFVFILFSFFCINTENVFALQITKVSGPTSYPWIEIYNDSSSSIDITGYKLLDSAASTTGHSISTTNIGTSFSIPANSYFILAKDETKSVFQNLSCPVFHSSLGVKLGDSISFKKSSDVMTFLVSSFDTLSSTSCSQSNSANTSTSTDATSTNATSTDTSNNSSSANVVYIYVPTNNQNKYGDITVLLPEEKIIPAGADSEFNVKAIDQDKKAITGLDFDWSFGDGGEKFGQKVDHHYIYPGEYTLVASADGYTVGGESKMNVKVVTPDISISKVGTSSKENFIDLTNNTDYDLVLSNFYLDLDNNFYKLPKNFTISKNKTVHVSGEALGFNLPATNISLTYPNKNLLVSYSVTLPVLEDLVLDTIDSATSTGSATSLAIEEEISEKDLQKAPEVKGEKQTNQSFVLKRLILNKEETKKTDLGNMESSTKVEPVNLNKNKNVDTGIVDWFKSLIY